MAVLDTPCAHGHADTTSDVAYNVGRQVFQGERPLCKHNMNLGGFQLGGIPPAPRGTPKIEEPPPPIPSPNTHTDAPTMPLPLRTRPHPAPHAHQH
jgi:hypothetical protein